mgnify:CR=1 FL=1
MKVIVLLTLFAIAFSQNYTGTWFVDFVYPTGFYNRTYPNSVAANSSFANITQTGSSITISFLSQTRKTFTSSASSTGPLCDSYFCRYFTVTQSQGLMIANYSIIDRSNINGLSITSLMVFAGNGPKAAVAEAPEIYLWQDEFSDEEFA